jgi:DNA-binding CsgD family transcriptional regulator
MQFERFIHETNGCVSKDQLVETFEQALRRFGIDKFVYCLARGSFATKKRPHHGLVRSYPEDWMKHYAQNNYIDLDPTYRYGLHTKGLFTWKDLDKIIPCSKKEKAVMREAEDAGLKNGITISIHGPYGEVIGFGFAGNDKKNELSKDELSLLYAAANQFHLAYTSLTEQAEAISIKLTDRQREILQWAAAGKSRSVISEIMAISEDTVDDHFRQIFKKLDCHDRIVAVLKAINLGLIRV